jgi:predicted MFS family arabinose efflux permease
MAAVDSASAFRRLAATAIGFRGSDQLMVAGTPLVVAAVFGQPADVVGLIVAIQGAAWLLVSLPAGVLIDRMAPQDALKRGMLTAVAGVVLAAAGLWFGSLPLFALGAFISASAAVIGFLAESATVQAVVPGAELPRANARLQLVQSAAMLAGPAAMGLLVERGYPLAGYGLALGLAVAGLVMALGFGPQPAREARARAPLAELKEGFAFVRSQPLLMGIVACALFWNLAFFVLSAIFVPLALGPIGINAAQVGAAQAAMGVGSLLAALTAGFFLSRWQPRIVLFFGPASSCVAAALMLIAAKTGGVLLPTVSFLLLGFGPILWFVCQNSIRQLVTPKGLLARVGSVIQVAIYGVRSVGALIGGVVAVQAGFDAALLLACALFALSALSVVFSALIRLRALPEAVNA